MERTAAHGAFARDFAGTAATVELPGFSGVCAEITFATTHYEDRLYRDLQVPFPRSLATARPQRRAEFLAGRYLAGQLLYRLGSMQRRIGIGSHGQPVWPIGFSGSITHTEDRAICAVAGASTMLGIDFEVFHPRHGCEELLAAIASKEEADLLASVFAGRAQGTITLFSAKESLFKALFPLVGDYFEFTDAALVDINPARGELRLEILRDLSPAVPRGKIFKLAFRHHAGGTLTWLAEENTGSPPANKSTGTWGPGVSDTRDS
ncbi:4'-phosphopantetheinyl transferase family protein [Microbulbifer sediminum]|uniref:4'-phosphopantetheinyl transferase family protein n=1 Tax=Microbulbifer sediminum TaxID=2904250 RepID=UPI001F01BDF4|nr:4'-phosphopantetheinyl transferase superfamily protein [Microbulbifer sediminum]